MNSLHGNTENQSNPSIKLFTSGSVISISMKYALI